MTDHASPEKKKENWIEFLLVPIPYEKQKIRMVNWVENECGSRSIAYVISKKVEKLW